MKVIKHPDTYVCEVCGTEYKYKELAEQCETFMPLGPISSLNVKVGDTILCESRYDGFFELKVIDIKLRVNYLWGKTLSEKDVTIKHLYKKGEYKGEELTALEYALLEQWQPHEYVCVSDDALTVCKDGTCANEWGVGDRLIVNPQWNPDFESYPDVDTCLTKWVEDGETVIRRGGKSWFNEHWASKVEFVGWGECE